MWTTTETTTARVNNKQTKDALLVPVGYEQVDTLRNFSQLRQREWWNKTGRVNESDFAPQQSIHHSFLPAPKPRTHKSLPTDWAGL